MNVSSHTNQIDLLISNELSKIFPEDINKEIQKPEDLEAIFNIIFNQNKENNIFFSAVKNAEADFILQLIEKLNFDLTKNKDDIIDCFVNTILFLYLEKQLSNEHESKIFKITNEIEIFQKNSAFKINDLKEFLIKKHPLLEKALVKQFETFQFNLNQELNNAKEWLRPVDQINLDGKNANDLFFTKTKGRPSSILIDLALIGLKLTADELEIENPYAVFIIPSLLLLAERFSDQLDKNDFNDYEKLRKRIAYLEIKYADNQDSKT